MGGVQVEQKAHGARDQVEQSRGESCAGQHVCMRARLSTTVPCLRFTVIRGRVRHCRAGRKKYLNRKSGDDARIRVQL